MNYQRVVVLGAGVTGKSVAEYLYDKGNYILGVDRNTHALNACPFFHEHYRDDSRDFPKDIDLCIRSPGVKTSHPWVVEAQRRRIPVFSDIQLALQDTEFTRYPSLGITGSNGKTTTALFLVHLFQTLGIASQVMGNIGIPILQTMRAPGIRIVEISSFQLVGQEIPIPALSGGMILNISPNHLDYHQTMQAYGEAKANLAKCLHNPTSLWGGENVPIGKPYLEHIKEIQDVVDKESALKPIYLHDRSNYFAAYVLAKEVVHVVPEAFVHAIRTFEKPAHRIEYLGEKRGVRYINDSKATTISAVEKALIAVKENVVVILGGRNKGSNFFSLIPILIRTAKHVVAMGECREEIAQALSDHLPLTQARDLQEAVTLAQRVAQPGDAILLSPGCASFDQFQSFEERGNFFKQLVGDVEALKI